MRILVKDEWGRLTAFEASCIEQQQGFNIGEISFEIPVISIYDESVEDDIYILHTSAEAAKNNVRACFEQGKFDFSTYTTIFYPDEEDIAIVQEWMGNNNYT